LNKTVKFLRLDDAGENFALEKACKQHHLGLQFEFSGPRTPQRNGKVERKFQTLYGRIRAMFNDSGIVNEIRDGLWAECASTASFYENRIVKKTTQQSALQLMYNKQFKGHKNLKAFGEIYVVTTKKAIQGE
jgi:transposase InsO family protein